MNSFVSIFTQIPSYCFKKYQLGQTDSVFGAVDVVSGSGTDASGTGENA